MWPCGAVGRYGYGSVGTVEVAWAVVARAAVAAVVARAQAAMVA